MDAGTFESGTGTCRAREATMPIIDRYLEAMAKQRGEALGDPGIVDNRRGWDVQGLDAARVRLETMRAIHNLDFSRSRRHGEEPMTRQQREATPPVDHPIVRTHPETGRKCLFLGDHAEYIVGLPYESVARILGIRPATARVYRRQAVVRLGRLLATNC